ncbi:Endonuclease/exonuclease/phosphatase [Leucosporidium creatinivorum]|uniref:Endonuclease/exonuclease/phosphatase n=1 Tax=Leucosporidium creatinivorum TaxID=106004 RepID=A0A1Y2F3N4_9BASI|nr:Endonuclease/exonuclease/phosphatase [Leucosporidium creatinivorum]
MGYRIQAATYNGYLSTINPTQPGAAVADWLGPTLGTTSSSEPPDFFAIGFQEMIPLHLALLGLTQVALDAHDHLILEAIESHAGGKETYTLLAKSVLGGIALLVYGRDKTVTGKVVDVRVAKAACGIGRLMGNKGAVGVRVVLEPEEEDEKTEQEHSGHTVLTFVTAHLAAHDSGLKRRNEDWRTIVERLVFAPGVEGESQHFSIPEGRRRDVFEALRRKWLPSEPKGVQIYDTSALFFFGDLNYRISTKTPTTLPLSTLTTALSPSTLNLPSLLPHDQLTHERLSNPPRSLHHLQEGSITFPPTYKYKVGTIDTFKSFKSRVPGWCDRILFATWADGDEGEGAAKVESYKSIPEFTQSDHKPVTAIISLPRPPTDSAAAGKALRLPWKAPFAIDPSWKQKQLIGSAMDRFVGLVWCILVLAGFNKDARIGLGNVLAMALAAYYRKSLFGL